MRNLKKFLALVLAMMMVLSLMVTANAAFADQDAVNDSDYADAIKFLEALGLVKGDTNGFRPEDELTRAEVSALLYRLYTGDTADDYVELWENSGYFSDVQAGKWYNGYVNFCANNGLLKGVGGNRYDPSAKVKGYEVLVMVLRAIGYDAPDEFSGTDWIFKAYGYGNRLGITKRIADGSLAANAKREVVAELFYQALFVDTVQYTMLNNYTPAKTLIADNEANRHNYKLAIEDGLTLPLNENLLYRNWKIVGKSPVLTYDNYGRPSEQWMEDDANDTMVESATDAGDAGKYIINVAADADVDDQVLKIALTPKKVYDNAVTECNLAKEVTGDKSIAWSNIIEVLNGNDNTNEINGSAAATSYTSVGYNNTLQTGRDYTTSMDKLHTTTDYIGATGRTTEIYKVPNGPWIFVYIDTFLGEVIETVPAIKDSNNHVIKAATATVAIGKGAVNGHMAEVEVETDKYEVGELILVQTYGGGHGTVYTLDRVDSPEKAPLEPADVPAELDDFYVGSAWRTNYVTTKPTTKQVTIKATVGAQDAKMGIIGTDGKYYWASNTFLASRTKVAPYGNNTNTSAVTVLEKWYDVDNDDYGITNSMIERTYELVLDHHGYIVGMKEVLSIDSTVGVITGVDSERVGSGKYLSEIEAYMVDGSTRTFLVPRLAKKSDTADTWKLHESVMDGNDTVYTYFTSRANADLAWEDTGYSAGTGQASYGSEIGVGSLVKFSQVTIDGKSYWKIDDYDYYQDEVGSVKFTDLSNPLTNNTSVTTDLGTVFVTPVGASTKTDAVTGVTNTLMTTRTAPMLDDESVVFVTEYDYRYNTGDKNEGSNINKSYNVYTGFKTLPTIEVGTDAHIVYQRLDKNPEYFLIGKADACNDYVIKNQATINLDESYLILSRGATYAEYSEYNVLKNGERTTLKVANGNDNLNKAIEQTMTNPDAVVSGTKANHENQLIIVTGRNSKGYVTSIIDTYDMQSGSSSQKDLLMNNGMWTGSSDATDPAEYTVRIAPDGTGSPKSQTDTGIRAYGNSVLQVATGSANSFLTIADGCKVLLVNRDEDDVYTITLNEAIRYANGVDGTGADTTLPSHGLVFEKDQYGYVCAIYVIDDWINAAS